MVTGPNPVPIEIREGEVSNWEDMRYVQEEADVIMIHHLIIIAEVNPTDTITILSDDTDVFVLLVHFYREKKLTCPLTMEATSNSDRKTIGIKETSRIHEHIVDGLIAAHALSGCDTVDQLYGIGKTKVVKVLQDGHQLSELGNVNAAMADVLQESTKFIPYCYGYSTATTITDVRIRMWKTKTSKANIVIAPKFISLPPTSEAFHLNVMRVHLQACIWKHAAYPEPPKMDVSLHGWILDRANNSVQPAMLPPGTAAAPECILKLIRCFCASCKSSRCSCFSAMLPCMMFCKCEGGLECCNEQTKATHLDETDIDDQS